MPDAFLTQTIGDARYVQAPGSFGAAGSIVPVAEGDTASAGVANAYARIDHRHAHSGNYRVVTSSTRPSSPTPGLRIFETDTGLTYVYLPTLSALGTTAGWYLDGEQVIARTVLGVAGTSISCTLPTVTNGWRLRFEIRAQHASSTNIDILLRFNGDTGNNYLRQYLFGNDTTVAADTDTVNISALLWSTMGNQSANRWSIARGEIHDYKGAAHKQVIGDYWDPRNLAQSLITHLGGVWQSTSAITSVSATAASGNFAAGSSLTCYASAA